MPGVIHLTCMGIDPGSLTGLWVAGLRPVTLRAWRDRALTAITHPTVVWMALNLTTRQRGLETGCVHPKGQNAARTPVESVGLNPDDDPFSTSIPLFDTMKLDRSLAGRPIRALIGVIHLARGKRGYVTPSKV